MGGRLRLPDLLWSGVPSMFSIIAEKYNNYENYSVCVCVHVSVFAIVQCVHVKMHANTTQLYLSPVRLLLTTAIKIMATTSRRMIKRAPPTIEMMMIP